MGKLILNGKSKEQLGRFIWFVGLFFGVFLSGNFQLTNCTFYSLLFGVQCKCKWPLLLNFRAKMQKKRANKARQKLQAAIAFVDFEFELEANFGQRCVTWTMSCCCSFQWRAKHPGDFQRGGAGVVVRRCQNAKRATESINKFGQAEMVAFFEVIYANYEQLQPKSDSGTGKGV